MICLRFPTLLLGDDRLLMRSLKGLSSRLLPLRPACTGLIRAGLSMGPDLLLVLRYQLMKHPKDSEEGFKEADPCEMTGTFGFAATCFNGDPETWNQPFNIGQI